MKGILSAALLAAVGLSACATGALAPSVTNNDFGTYYVDVVRTGCNIAEAQIRSKGEAIPAYTYHQWVAGASGATSSIFSINCPPVFGGGRAYCTVIPQSTMSPVATAGLGCPGWNQFDFRRMN